MCIIKESGIFLQDVYVYSKESLYFFIVDFLLRWFFYLHIKQHLLLQVFGLLKKEKIRLFGELGFGFSGLIARNRFNPMPFAGKFTPIGIMFGSKDIFGSAELSLGSEGSTLVVGCGWRF